MLYLVTQIIVLLVLSLLAGFAMAWLWLGRGRGSASASELRDTKQALRTAKNELERRPDEKLVKQLKDDLSVRPTAGEAALLRAQVVDLERRLGYKQGAPAANHAAKIAPNRSVPPPPPPAPPKRAPKPPPAPAPQTWPDTALAQDRPPAVAAETPNNVIDLRPPTPKLPPMPITGAGTARLPYEAKDDAI